MTAEKALYKFWSSFGLPAYEENSVPAEAKTPYITYQVATGDFYSGPVMLSASIWDRNTSWIPVNEKMQEVKKKISKGATLLCDDGAIWLTLGNPNSQNLPDAEDSMMKRKYINILADFQTAI